MIGFGHVCFRFAEKYFYVFDLFEAPFYRVHILLTAAEIAEPASAAAALQEGWHAEMDGAIGAVGRVFPVPGVELYHGRRAGDESAVGNDIAQ